MTKDISNKQQSYLRISEKDVYPLKEFQAGSETTKNMHTFKNSKPCLFVNG